LGNERGKYYVLWNIIPLKKAHESLNDAQIFICVFFEVQNSISILHVWSNNIIFIFFGCDLSRGVLLFQEDEKIKSLLKVR